MKNTLRTTLFKIYDNCLYSSISHAISNAKYPIMAYSQSWDGNNYSFHHGYSLGTITFDLPNKTLVGAIRDEKSHRRSWYPNYNAEDLFNEAPEAVKILAANEALQYLFDEIDDVTKPVATTVLWSEDDQIIIGDTLDDFINNGGEFIADIIAQPFQDLQTYWKVEYDLSSKELEIVNNLFHLKKSGETNIKKKSLSFINKKSIGFNDCVQSLIEIGFTIK